MYDVVVVGASTAGLYAAELLAKKGKKVILFERDQEISPGRRTYIITPDIFNYIPDLDQDLIRHRISSILVRAGDISTEVLLKAPDIVIERTQLISKMLVLAKKAGVEIISGGEFIGFDHSGPELNLVIRIRGVRYKCYDQKPDWG